MVLVPWGYAIFGAQYSPLALLLKKDRVLFVFFINF